jgi:hypothetical protein
LKPGTFKLWVHCIQLVQPHHGEQARGEERDVLVGHRENEGRGVREEEGDEVAHLDVLERDGGGHHALARLQSGQHALALAVQVESPPLADVPQQ